MANYIGIDYGHKRIGLAFADELGVATPLPALCVEGKKAQVNAILEVIANRKVDELVVGYPINMDGSVGFKAKEVDAFIESIEKRIKLPVHRADERLSTHQVVEDFRATGRKTKTDRKTRRSGSIDSAAAALILREFLAERNPLVFPAEPFEEA